MHVAGGTGQAVGLGRPAAGRAAGEARLAGQVVVVARVVEEPGARRTGGEARPVFHQHVGPEACSAGCRGRARAPAAVGEALGADHPIFEPVVWTRVLAGLGGAEEVHSWWTALTLGRETDACQAVGVALAAVGGIFQVGRLDTVRDAEIVDRKHVRSFADNTICRVEANACFAGGVAGLARHRIVRARVEELELRTASGAHSV